MAIAETGAAGVAAVEGPRASQILGTLPPPGAGDLPGTASGLHTTNGLGLGTPRFEAAGASAVQQMEGNAAWPMISRLSVTLAARIPMGGFRVRDLLALAAGQTIASAWQATEDVPLLAGDLQVGWSEFEVVGRRMALRLTRLV
jgi:hypothetical protein